jgi:hypothetical protein
MTLRIKLVILAAVSTAIVAAAAHASATPVGPLPKGPVAAIVTTHGQSIAIALPRPARRSGLVWRIARRYDSRVVQQVSEANVGPNIVVVYKVIGRGQTSIVYAQTRGDASRTALAAITHRVRAS